MISVRNSFRFVRCGYRLIPDMSVTNAVPSEIVQQVADYFSILSEPMRLRILNLLRDGEQCVQELVEATSTSQANVSKHLKVMLQAGIVARRTQGTLAYYSVSDDLGFQLCNLVCDRLASRIEQQALYFREFSVTTTPLSCDRDDAPIELLEVAE
jgi:DNA-binding transcriptional ArsR family regulator